jgi:hypothetical protein
MTPVLVKNYIIAPIVHNGIVPFLDMIAIRGRLRNKFYGGGLRRKIYFSKIALEKLGITPSNLWSSIQFPLFSPVEVSELNQAAEEYQGKYGPASLKKAGREQGRFFSRKKLTRAIIPEDPFRACRVLMDVLSLSIGAKGYMKNLKIGRYVQCSYPESHFPFELSDGEILPGEKYFWAFVQGVASSDLCHDKQMRAEVTRERQRVHVVSRSVEEWGDYLLDNIEKLF